MARNSALLVLTAILMALAAVENGRGASVAEEASRQESVIRGYLQAIYARDFAAAYRLLSSQDQRVKSLNDYLRAQRPLNGFALQLARAVAASIQIEVVKRESADSRQLVTVRYRAPDPEKLAPLVYDWNGYRLNSLSAAQRRQLMELIETQQRRNEIAMTSGEERLALVREDEDWRIFLDWGRGVTIPLRTVLGSLDGILDVQLSPQRITVQPGELFSIALKVANQSQKRVSIRIGHVVQPQELANHLEIVQCGFVLPIRVEPGATQEYSGTYLLSGSLPAQTKELRLELDFRRLSD